jgi:hypothetical protein
MKTKDLILETRGPRLDVLKKHRQKLSDHERQQVVDGGAVWHHGPGGKPSPAVWKSSVNGKTWYVSNTHRCYDCSPSLRGAIRAFHSKVEPSS